PVLDRMVVSDTGELWSPQTAPSSTAPKLAINSASPPGTAFIMSPARASRMPNEPHDVPVANAISAAMTNSAGTNHTAGIASASTTDARYSPVPSSPIKSPRTQANSRMKIAPSMDLAP